VANKITIYSTAGNEAEILNPVLLEHEAIVLVIRTLYLINGTETVRIH